MDSSSSAEKITGISPNAQQKVADSKPAPEGGGGRKERPRTFTFSPDELRAAIRAAGITPPDDIHADAELHRFSSNGKAGDDAGWYVVHANGIPAGAFGCWRTGLNQSWRADIGRTLTKKETTALARRMEAMASKRAAAQAARREAAAGRAVTLWEGAGEALANHPYLTGKGIQAHGLRLYSAEHQGALSIGKDDPMDCAGALIVPMQDASGQLSTLEFIQGDGEKRFLPKGEKRARTT